MAQQPLLSSSGRHPCLARLSLLSHTTTFAAWHSPPLSSLGFSTSCAPHQAGTYTCTPDTPDLLLCCSAATGVPRPFSPFALPHFQGDGTVFRLVLTDVRRRGRGMLGRLAQQLCPPHQAGTTYTTALRNHAALLQCCSSRSPSTPSLPSLCLSSFSGWWHCVHTCTGNCMSRGVTSPGE